MDNIASAEAQAGRRRWEIRTTPLGLAAVRLRNLGPNPVVLSLVGIPPLSLSEGPTPMLHNIDGNFEIWRIDYERKLMRRQLPAQSAFSGQRVAANQRGQRLVDVLELAPRRSSVCACRWWALWQKRIHGRQSRSKFQPPPIDARTSWLAA